MFKIGFVGNSCTGKTTSAFNLIKYLKFKKTRTGYCEDVCRFVTFPPEKFDTDPRARLHVLFKQMANECMNEVRDDVDYLITERTVIDWYLYYLWTCDNVKKDPSDEVWELVEKWIDQYDLIFFMDSKGWYYVDDGYRPASTKIRNEIEEKYQDIKGYLIENFPEKTIIVTSDSVEKRVQEVEDHIEKWLKINLIVRKPKQ